jgi:transcriptional regulator with XRE-family HTH domain
MNQTASSLNFGSVLKEWRQHRRMSQMDLSFQSGISQRHISFLETGRSKASAGTVIALADSMDVPLRERNVLLESAGFRAHYKDSGLDASEIALFREAIQATIDHHEPYPAIVLDGRWNMTLMNSAALAFFGQYVDPIQALTDIGSPEAFQVARLCMADAGLAPYISNWTDLLFSFLQRARRALLFNPNDRLLPELIDEILSHRRSPKSWGNPDWATPPAPAITMNLEKDGVKCSLFTMLAHFGSPQQVSLEEMSVELFYPADKATKQRLLVLASR